MSWLLFDAILRASFQPLDISINQSANKFISNKFNALYAHRVSKQLSNGVAPGDVKVSLKLSDLKSFHARWIFETCNHLKHQNDFIIKGFDAAGISQAITCANDVFTRVENSFETTTEFLVVFSLFFHENITLFDLLNQLTSLFFVKYTSHCPLL